VPTVLVEKLVLKLDGDFVRIRATSGDKTGNSIIPMRHFEQWVIEGQRVVAKWRAAKCEVVSINKVRRTKH